MPHATKSVDQRQLTDISWRALIKIGLVAAILLLAVSMYESLTALFESLIIAAFLATAADAVVRALQRRGMSRKLAITTVIVSFFATIIVAAVLIVPDMIDQGAKLIRNGPDIVSNVESTKAWTTLEENVGVSDEVLDRAREFAVQLPQAVASVLGAAIGGVFSLITMLFAVTFLLTSGGRAMNVLVRVVPRIAEERAWDVVAGAYDNVGRYVIGATVQAMLAGTGITILLLILGVPYAFALGMFTFLLNYIPLIGATIGAIPAIAVAFFDGGPWTALAVLGYIVVYQQLENTIIQPRIQGKVVRLPAIAIFFSVFVGANIFGVIGALFAVPVASVIAIILRHWFEFTGRDQVTIPSIFDAQGNVVRHASSIAANEAADRGDDPSVDVEA